MKTTLKDVLLINSCGLVLISTTFLFSLPIICPAMGSYIYYESVPLKPADIGIVLAGGDRRRVDGAIALYHQQKVRKLIMTGGDDSWHIAAEVMKEQAVSKGVPSENILIEGISKSTFGNAQFSKPIVLEQKATSIIVITSTSHSRRSFLTFKKMFEGSPVTDIQISSTPDGIDRKYWWKDHESTDTVLSEWAKLIVYFFKGLI